MKSRLPRKNLWKALRSFSLSYMSHSRLLRGAGPDMGAGAGPDMGAGASNGSAPYGDDVVDGDYKEV